MEARLLSMKFQGLIEKENILLDKRRLVEWNNHNNMIKYNVLTAIDTIRDEFAESIHDGDIEKLTLIYKLTEKIKSIL